VPHVTKRAAAGALVAHDHEGGGAFAKAFADVGATGFFAYGDQIIGPQNILDFVKPGGRGAGPATDPVGFF
jgi:hypothetical protein